MKNVGEFLILIAYVAMLFVLVRPKSQGPTLITNAANGVASVIGAATGGSNWNG